MQKDFRKINFGYSSAEQEHAKDPSLLLDGFVDLHDVCQRAYRGDAFLVLGYKGSDKTAIAERLRLQHEENSQSFITFIDLADFPYATFSQIVRAPGSPEAKYPSAWSWLLLIQLLASMDRDQGLKPDNLEPFRETIGALKTMGLLPISGIQQLVRYSAEKTLKLKVPTFFERSVASKSEDVDIPNYVDNLKRLVLELKTDSRHLLILDGLDEIV